jgi:hypothetical protein
VHVLWSVTYVSRKAGIVCTYWESALKPFIVCTYVIVRESYR